ncbi:T9SS type A sorting domain-containing protein [Psychroserpens mesophilus]|uniref:T9SS type A sorting domain-containing protein n=1 Tax=Psychroserpens mesophilus TaxID=325473 RepID=UPI003D653122
MKNFTFKSIFAVLAFMFAMTSYSQDRTCGMVEYMEEMLKDPVLAKEYEENQRKFKAEVAKRLSTDFQARGGATIEIPVAVHFPTGNVNDRACLEALAQNQIDILNADYTATNSDISTWNNSASAFYPGLNPGSANIVFCLATSNHPAAVSQLVEGQPAVTIGYNFANGAGFPEMDANFQGYLNFLVKPIGGTALGYSPLGGSVANGMAVVINTNTFGSGTGCPSSGIVPSFPFNQGRTTTHELGHFFNLNHTFIADGGGNCSQPDADGIADTPKVANSTYGCPSNPTPFACNVPERRLTMNYMDYVNDACMYMFTPGQMNVAEAYISANLAPAFKPNTCLAPNPGFALAADNSPVSSCPNTDTQVTFDLTYTTILDFNETTTFSAIGQPAGSTVSFSPTSLNNDGSFTMTVGNLGATVEGEYTITVTGTSNSVTETVDVLLKNTCTEIVCAPYASGDLNITTLDPSGTNPGVVSGDVVVPDSQIIESMTVTVDIDHTYVQDLILQLVHPSSTQANPVFVNLWDRDCVSENDLTVTFDDEAGAIACSNPTSTTATISGTFAPNGPLSTFDGLEAQGTWTLLVADFANGDTGTFNNWSMTICSEQGLSINEFSSDSFAIFPNPNNGEFTIKLNSNSGSDIKVDVLDIRGRRIFNNVYTNTGDFNETVNLSNVQSGMYLVTVNDGNNKVTKRIIVE